MQMKLFFTAIVLALVAAVQAADASTRCESQFRPVEVVEIRDTDFGQLKVDYVKALVRMGLSETAYVTKWSLTAQGKQTAKGRFADRGEFVVTGIPSNKLDAWMNRVGKDTVGLVINGHPADGPSTASLRVGKYYFEFHDIRARVEETQLDSFRNDSLMEITIPIPASEQKAILNFIKARQRDQIIAKHSRGAGVKKGEPIRPDFDSRKFTLAEESCAGACTSWFDRRWLEHYDAPEALLKILERFDLQATFVAKQMVWGHVRLPGPLGITIFDIDSSPELQSAFREKNEWHSVRGIPAYGYIPDPKSGLTGTVKSKRLTLDEWLRQN